MTACKYNIKKKNNEKNLNGFILQVKIQFLIFLEKCKEVHQITMQDE